VTLWKRKDGVLLEGSRLFDHRHPLVSVRSAPSRNDEVVPHLIPGNEKPEAVQDRLRQMVAEVAWALLALLA
jgi:hypothetical protein